MGCMGALVVGNKNDDADDRPLADVVLMAREERRNVRRGPECESRRATTPPAA